MNNQRRAVLEALAQLITDAKDDLEAVKYDEEGYRDNMPENLQNSERFEKTESACDALEDALSLLEDAIEKIEEARA